MNSPWIAVNRLIEDEGRHILMIENGSKAVDCLQSYIDALVDLGRMQDGKLGPNFFQEWRRVIIEDESVEQSVAPSDANAKKTRSAKKKRKRDEEGLAESERKSGGTKAALRLGSLSFHNCAQIGLKTLQAMEVANVGSVLGTLDLTGVHSLTDVLLGEFVRSCPRIQRLSLKNCRKITGEGIMFVKGLSDLKAIDVGGSFNIIPANIIELVQCHQGTLAGTFTEIHASGLGWTDGLLETLLDHVKSHLTGLSIGFSPRLTAKSCTLIGQAGETLTSLAMHFCDCMTIDYTIQLGKLLTKLRVLDIRGASTVNSITPMLDARATVSGYNVNDENSDPFPFLFVLARYTNITSSSLVDTRAVHSFDFECIIDGGGLGGGIRRLTSTKSGQNCL